MPFASVAATFIVAGSGSTSSKGGSPLGGILPLVLIVVVGYLLLVRLARNRQRQAQQTRSNVQPGVVVTTTAGLIATVVSVDEEAGTVTLEIAPGVHATFVKAAIGRVNTPPEPPDGSHEQIEPDAVDETPSTDPPASDAPDPDSTDR